MKTVSVMFGHFARVALLLLLSVPVFWLLKGVEDVGIVKFYNLSSYFSHDLVFNDIYYQMGHAKANFRGPKDVVLVNTGSVPPTELRSRLLLVLPELRKDSVKAIGIDLLFRQPNDSATDEALYREIIKSKAVLASGEKVASIFGDERHKEVLFGDVSLPDNANDSKRHYYNYRVRGGKRYVSFSNQLYRRAYGKAPEFESDSINVLVYASAGNGVYDVFNPKKHESGYNFPAVELDEYFDPRHRALLKQMTKGKTVVLGYLGTGSFDNPDDMRDKHKVPTDRSLVDRKPLMPGAAVHANAFQMYAMQRDFKMERPQGIFWDLAFIALLFCLCTVYYLADWFFPVVMQVPALLLNFVLGLALFYALVYLNAAWFMPWGIYADVNHLVLWLATIGTTMGVVQPYLRQKVDKDKAERNPGRTLVRKPTWRSFSRRLFFFPIRYLKSRPKAFAQAWDEFRLAGARSARFRNYLNAIRI